jgi:hypothetical protein
VPSPAAAAVDRSFPAVRVDEAPVIDGVLDDAAWDAASFVGEFTQKEPVFGAEPSRATEVAIVYDDEALYFAARMQAAGPEDVQAVMTRRDVTGSAERIILSLDTFRDQRTAYSFAVTAAGVRADWYHPDDSEFSRDHSFNPVWQAEARVGENGWTAEMRIPFSQLRFPDRQRQVWGINVNRYIAHANEDIFWIPVPKDQTGWSSWFGTLEGLDTVEPRRRIELLPYAAADMTLLADELVDDADPFRDPLDADARIGLDAKIGLGPSFTLDATINPDFGQVEADPAVVNLTAFETSFAERRPFFIEGAELLAGNGPGYFYSRRIGAAPRGSAEGDFVDQPRSTPILGAAKITGRRPSGLSLGALAAVTGRAYARTYEVAGDVTDRVLVEPLTGYGVLRAQQELGSSGSLVGASATVVQRDLDGDDPLTAILPGGAITGGADWILRTTDGTYQLAGFLGGSVVHGEPAAIARLQRSSAHYFQRPDADHLELDPDRTTMAGLVAKLEASRRSGSWRWNLGATTETPGFETNDAGLLYSADDINPYGSIQYRDSEPGDLIHHWDVSAGAATELNYGLDRKPTDVLLYNEITWTNFWRSTLGARLDVPGVNDDLTRGGPLIGLGWGAHAEASISNSFSARTQWRGSLAYVWHEVGPIGVFASAGVTIRPIDRVELSLGPRLTLTEDNRQYVDTLPEGRAETFGQRYVFATVEREELAIQTRGQLVLLPDLSFELYLEPFVSSGRFTRFGELPEPGSEDLRRYGEAAGTTLTPTPGGYTVTDGAGLFMLDDPDFTILSLRSTAVLRWELRPGSTLYAVWQQSRFESRPAAGDGFLDDTIAAPGAHTLAIKLSYWLPL